MGQKDDNRSNINIYFVVGIAALFVVSFFLFSSPALFMYHTKPSSETTTRTAQSAQPGTEAQFAYLRGETTNQCAGPAFIESKTDGERLQGSCCSAMDFHHYQEQVEGLKQYAASDASAAIPQDPYDISVALAKKLLQYDKDITLTTEQQVVYDQAVKLSEEKGPCCCKCWRWYAFRGQAKYLIAHHGFNAQQIADLWGLEDGCGGAGHNPHSGGTAPMSGMM